MSDMQPPDDFPVRVALKVHVTEPQHLLVGHRYAHERGVRFWIVYAARYPRTATSPTNDLCLYSLQTSDQKNPVFVTSELPPKPQFLGAILSVRYSNSNMGGH
jgi:hypothetical protein